MNTSQGISQHIDVLHFDSTVASISLGSASIIDFVHSKTNEKIPILLEPRSLLVLKGDARYIWKHGIASRKTDKYNGNVFSRDNRYSGLLYYH